MASQTEGQHGFEFLSMELDRHYNREAVTILAGSGADRVLTSGMVLGKQATGTAAATADGDNTGDGAMGAITVSGSAKAGIYELVITEPGTDLGTFEVTDPDGELVDTGVVASAFSGGGLAFTLADGAADFVAGDRITIVVTITAEKFLQFDEGASTGEQLVAGILGENITALDAVDNPKGVALVRGPAIVTTAELVWPAGISAADKAIAVADLDRLLGGIIQR